MKPKHSKGALLALTALMLPAIIGFWAWIISGAMLLNFKISEQIAVDSAAISGVSFQINSGSTNATRARTRAQTIYRFYTGSNPSVSSTGSGTSFRVTVNATAPAKTLFMTQSNTLSSTATARRLAVPGTDRVVLNPLP